MKKKNIQTKIEVKNITKAFGNNRVLRGISFDVAKGESFVVVGGSGTGKSVLIKSMIGLVIPDKGSQVKIDGEDITFYDMAQRQHIIDKVGVLFQGGALFDSLPVWANVAFCQLQEKTLSPAKAKRLAIDKLGLVGLKAAVADQFPAELSGGMQKRVALARAIAVDPEIIFFDEPTAGLDPIMSGVISELILKCSKELGATTITITHDMHCAKVIADKIAMIHEGNFIWQGKGKDMLKSGNKYLDQFIHGRAEGPISAVVS
jgi:phospholipid/cholesterol/gamma-HCH transport system ATP-binding protein